MPGSSLSAVVQHLRAAAGRDGGGRTDGELLTLFLSRRDEDALAALIERHAPMVWGVCCRILRNPPDAEDAFQATFLVLVQKAATVAPRDMVGNWLHGVAHQTAVRLKATAAKRGWREVQMDVTPEPAVAEAREEELLHLLDEELGRLPRRFRALIVLCDLEGRTRKEVARHLGCPEGTVASGLARARELLAKRLTRRGLAVSAGSLAATLSHSAASADVPASAVASAINVATLLAAGQASAISGPVAALTQGVLKTMFLKKTLTATMAVLALGVAVVTCGSLAVGQTEGSPAVGKDAKAPVAEKPVEPSAEQEREPFTAWGKEVGGLQAGLGLLPGAKRVYRHGETVTLVVRVRNVGKQPVKFEYVRQFLDENPPAVTTADGKTVPQSGTRMLGTHGPTEVNLEPGKEVVLETRMHGAAGSPYTFLPEVGGASPAKVSPLLVERGKIGLHYDAVLGNSSSGKIKIDPTLAKLATGTLELEVKEPEKGPQDKNEAFTAWGQESGGLQAGLGLLPGAKRAYRHGETVTLVVRVRNVGKETVKFEYVRQFLDENRPTVTTAEGKNLAQSKTDMLGFHGPTEVTLEPGKEVVLETRMHGASGSPYALLPEGGGLSTTKAWPLFVGTGKVSLRFDAVFGNSSTGKIKLDPALEKLGTGKLELEVGKLERPEVQPMPNAVAFTLKNATVDDVDAKSGVISVSFGNKEKPTRLVNVPLDAGARVVASHVLPGVANNLPFEWSHVERLKGKVVSVRLAQTADGLAVVSIASGND